MQEETVQHELRPKKPTWTHLALCVTDISKTIAWYEEFTHLKLLVRGEDESGYNAWVGDDSQADAPFLLVLAQFFEGKDPFAPAKHAELGPFAHIGIELPSKEMVDEMARKGEEAGCLAFGPMQMPKQIGYICFLKDPDGNTVEFSFDQGVYEKARAEWGK